VRIATKTIPETFAFADLKGEHVIRTGPSGKTTITAKFFEDDRQLTVLTIQGYTVASNKPHNASFSFISDEIGLLLEFIANVRTVAFQGRGLVNISDDELRRLVLSRRQAFSLVEENEDLFAEVIRTAMTKGDIVAVAYRKQQLDVFRRLLEDAEFFEHVRKTKGCTREGGWQRFFEKNPWIFGYGLNYVWTDKLDKKKLEQVVQGFRVSQPGKRVDGLMKTMGAISSLCFVEIKIHDTPLLSREHRPGCWSA
jgi:hypothetical protein